jgi:serine/threonine protein kinase
VGRVDSLRVGDPGQIGSFRLLGRLGEGGMGRVFLGSSPGGRKVAIKVVHPHYAGDPEFRRRFAREVDAARQVGGFHTAAVVAADPDADPPWMATAYIPGPSLAEAIEERGPLAEAGVRELGAALAEGLAAIHACGLIHRDLKPSNVILADDGPRIIDFGIAKGAGTTRVTSSRVLIGTLRYMSPEQLRARELTPASDIFALGTVLAYAATGHDPFDAPDVAVISLVLNDPPNLDPLTGDLHDIIAACLAKEPGDRPSPAGLLARFNLPEAASDEPPSDPAPVAIPTADHAPTRTSALPSPEANEWEASAEDTISVSPIVPVGHTDSPAQQAGVAAELSGRPQRRRHRRRTVLIAAGTTAVALAAFAAFQLGNHPANPVDNHPQIRSTTTPQTRSTNHPANPKYSATFTDPASGGVGSVAFGPDGTLATSDRNGSTYLWNAATHMITATLTDPDGHEGTSVAFGPNGTLATGDANSSTYLWNTTTDNITATLTDPTGTGVASVAFGPNGTLATSDNTGSTYIWNTTTKTITATFTDPASKGVDSVSFGPGGTLATGDSNGSTYLWRIS